MDLLKRRPVLLPLGVLAALEWAVLFGLYSSMSFPERVDLQMSPTIMVFTILGVLVLGAGLLVILVLAAVPPLRPYVPLVVGLLLVLAVVSGIFLPAIAAHPTCGCEPS